MARTYSLDEVVEMLKQRQGERSVSAFAGEVGVSDKLLYAIYAGDRNPGQTVLDYLGIVAETTKETVYRKAS
jgi:hypothetical protein